MVSLGFIWAFDRFDFGILMHSARCFKWLHLVSFTVHKTIGLSAS